MISRPQFLAGSLIKFEAHLDLIPCHQREKWDSAGWGDSCDKSWGNLWEAATRLVYFWTLLMAVWEKGMLSTLLQLQRRRIWSACHDLPGLKMYLNIIYSTQIKINSQTPSPSSMEYNNRNSLGSLSGWGQQGPSLGLPLALAASPEHSFLKAAAMGMWWRGWDIFEDSLPFPQTAW